MKRTRITFAVLILPLIYILTGCYPDKIDYVDEYDLAATAHDEEADFSVFTTFSLIDTIVHVTEDGEEDPNLDRSNDRFILNELRSNMLDMGYSEIESPDSIDNRPDLLLTVSALSADFTYYYSWYPYYWGWYPYWPYSYSGSYYWWGYPGWGWGYPMYGGSYSTGTLVVDMWDTQADPEEDRSGLVWTGVVDGLLSGTTTQSQSRLEKQINQLFIQSPYLQQ